LIGINLYGVTIYFSLILTFLYGDFIVGEYSVVMDVTIDIKNTKIGTRTGTKTEPKVKMGAVEFFETIVKRARALGASDIHIDPFPQASAVRFRVDGLLRTICTIPPPLHPEIIARIKILAGLRIDVHQTPQDGRFRLATKVASDGIAADPNDICDIRVSILPTQHGENAVIRLLSRRIENNSVGSLIDLGFSSGDMQNVETALKKRHGLILITGPTGSGKTTTLYALLTMLHSGTVSIVTLEDPIEYSIDGIRQVQVDHKYGMTFATGLRAILRQDPDIIMIGEIRDKETATIAVHSALTGHLVISTVHTNSALAVLPRLLDMGIDAYLISATLSLVIGQRLVRLVCRECSRERTDGDTTDGHTSGNASIAHCARCNNSGYKGRIGIYETFLVNEPIRAAIAGGISLDTVGIVMHTMREDGIEKVAEGITSREELTRVMYE
jgi:type II secretory ATPase GspE/PulE/Tfp pilus assembly ATPase PilB-like protein